jgi:FAD synthetase
MASGVFDILHLGHLHYLEESKKLGDELIVVIATDKRVRELKHEPITNENTRLELIKAMKPVDKAILGSEGDIYRIVEEIKPDIITLGFDQEHDEQRIIGELSERGLNVEVKRLPKFDTDLNGTRKIIQKIIGWYNFQKKMDEIEEGGNNNK